MNLLGTIHKRCLLWGGGRGVRKITNWGDFQGLRELIAKMGENSPLKFWPVFLFISLTYATYLGVLENIKSSALGSKTGLQDLDFNFKPKYNNFDHFDKMVSSSMGWKGWNFNLMWSKIAKTKANSQEEKFWKSEFFSCQHFWKIVWKVGA